MGIFKPGVFVGSVIGSLVCSVVFSAFYTTVAFAQAKKNNKAAIINAINEGALSDEQFSLLSQFIEPSDKEGKWLETPWVPSIHQGRVTAAAAGKPIFLWAMNGDPLGCV